MIVNSHTKCTYCTLYFYAFLCLACLWLCRFLHDRRLQKHQTHTLPGQNKLPVVCSLLWASFSFNYDVQSLCHCFDNLMQHYNKSFRWGPVLMTEELSHFIKSPARPQRLVCLTHNVLELRPDLLRHCLPRPVLWPLCIMGTLFH